MIEAAIDFVNEIEVLISELDDVKGYAEAIKKKIQILARKAC